MSLPSRLLVRLLTPLFVVLAFVLLTFPLRVTLEDRPAGNAPRPVSAPLPERFSSHVRGLLAGDFGESTRTRQPATQVVSGTVGPTLLLVGAAIGIAAIVMVPLGLLASRRGVLAWPARFLGLLAGGTPFIGAGLLLMLVFALWNTTLPAAGYGKPEHLVLPAVTLVLLVIPEMARGIRAATLVARPGVRRVFFVPMVGLIGIDLGVVAGGALAVESLFAWPGLGRTFVTALQAADAPVLIAVLAVIVGLIAAANLLIALFADPLFRWIGDAPKPAVGRGFGAIGLILLGVVVLIGPAVALSASFSQPDALPVNVVSRLAPPSGARPFGSDALGRDVGGMLAVGVRNAAVLGLGGAALALVAGIVVGVVGGIARRIGFRPIHLIDTGIVALLNGWQTLPALIVVVTFAEIARYSAIGIASGVAAILVVPFARIVRRQIVGRAGIIGSFLTVASTVVAAAALAIAIQVLADFLGFGLARPSPTLGGILGDARQNVPAAPWLVYGPTLAILALLTGLGLISAGLGSAGTDGGQAIGHGLLYWWDPRPLKAPAAAPIGVPASPPDPATTYVASDPSTHYLAPAMATQYVAPDMGTQVVAPDMGTQYVTPNPATSYVAPDPATTYVAPNPTTTYIAPEYSTGRVGPDPATTTDIPNPATTYVVPDPSTTVLLNPAVTTPLSPETTEVGPPAPPPTADPRSTRPL